MYSAHEWIKSGMSIEWNITKGIKYLFMLQHKYTLKTVCQVTEAIPKAMYGVNPFVGNVQNRQSVETEMKLVFARVGSQGEGKRLLTGTGFLLRGRKCFKMRWW